MDQSIQYLMPSILDTDLYKFTMQQAVLHHYPNVAGAYRFTHRDKDVYFPRACIDAFREAISAFSDVALTPEEQSWLGETCPYFTAEYLTFLKEYRFKPEQVTVTFTPVSPDGNHGKVDIEARGPWRETILWEVPLMACLSELYFRIGSTDWSYDGQDGALFDTGAIDSSTNRPTENAFSKAQALLRAGCTFSEFGTRRRRSLRTQELVMSAIIRASKGNQGKGKFAGTSNAYFARKYGVPPIGTIAHEWFMGVAAIEGYDGASTMALKRWEQVYPKHLQITLTDTFSTEEFDKDRAHHWKTLRQDSGDPFVFAPRAKKMYEDLGIDISTKSIIFSDALDVEKALKLKEQCDELGFSCSFGIGTFLTNDFKTLSSGGKDKSRALNMVIKLGTIDGKECVKISDELTKNTGDRATVESVKRRYGILT
ncbi:nicotinate phosphoribosyltransferase [Leucogyrophana mollusca]|uniref:Nicotinate phosphoribosyltransferase n=1 Tax=Leucogyrophana mollusca TaxID=85980 RepID=A0ACB8BRL2_9AGAM|nr:nicotinate phosphoribosyltransferase [Leucogyrophana mollusca]